MGVLPCWTGITPAPPARSAHEMWEQRVCQSAPGADRPCPTLASRARSKEGCAERRAAKVEIRNPDRSSFARLVDAAWLAVVLPASWNMAPGRSRRRGLLRGDLDDARRPVTNDDRRAERKTRLRVEHREVAGALIEGREIAVQERQRFAEGLRTLRHGAEVDDVTD